MDPELGATPDEFKAMTGVTPAEASGRGVAVTPEAVSQHREDQQAAGNSQASAPRLEDAAIVQGVTAEALQSNESPLSQAEALLKDFKELNRIYNGDLLTRVPTKDGSEKLVFARVLMNDSQNQAYMSGLDNEGLFLVKGAAAEKLYANKRFHAGRFADTNYDSYLSTSGASVDEYGKPEEVRVTSGEAMRLWETSYRATKDRIDSSRLELPNIKKAREIVQQAIVEKKAEPAKAA